MDSCNDIRTSMLGIALCKLKSGTSLDKADQSPKPNSPFVSVASVYLLLEAVCIELLVKVDQLEKVPDRRDKLK